mgnify:CR=1 FL=1
MNELHKSGICYTYIVLNYTSIAICHIKIMNNIYELFNVHQSANSMEILESCKKQLSEWKFDTVFLELKRMVSHLQATLSIKRVFEEGEEYLKVSARILLNPETRQTYDAYLDALSNPTIEKIKLTQARIQWFNSNNNTIHFSKNMLKRLTDTNADQKKETTENLPKRHKKSHGVVKPICRQCRSQFDFNDDYLVLHCDCTTRTGHPDCMNSFKERVKGKCPVCRKTLLVRYQISKYLFWQNKEKFKLIT